MMETTPKIPGMSPPRFNKTLSRGCFSSMNADQIHRLLDNQLACLNHPWAATIPFHCIVVGRITTNTDIGQILRQQPTVIVICEFINGLGYPNSRLYFSPTKYPPPAKGDKIEKHDNATTCSFWLFLMRDLFTASHNAGSPLVATGQGKIPNSRQILWI